MKDDILMKIVEDVSRNTEILKSLRENFATVAGRLDKSTTAINKQLADHEKRLSALETAKREDAKSLAARVKRGLINSVVALLVAIVIASTIFGVIAALNLATGAGIANDVKDTKTVIEDIDKEVQ